MALVWEKLESSDSGRSVWVTLRAKVPGGWLVIVGIDDGGGITFYPDPSHLWNGESLP